MTGLIRLLGQHELGEYSSGDGEFWLKDSGEGKEVLERLVPPAPLVKFWEDSGKSEEAWNACKCAYEYLLQSSEARKDLLYLSVLAKRGKTYNVVCDCWDGEKCIRSLVFNALADMQASVFLG